jgi:hypothetical protein
MKGTDFLWCFAIVESWNGSCPEIKTALDAEFAF